MRVPRKGWLAFVLAILVVFCSNTYAQTNCNQMPITTEFIKSSTVTSSTYEHMLCDSDFKTSQDAMNAGIGLGAIVYGIPLQLNTTFSKEQRETWKHEHCESTRSTSHYAQSYEALLKLVPPEAYKAWVDCVTRNANGFVCWFEQPTEDNYEWLTLHTGWKELPGGSGGTPRVHDSTVLGATRPNGAGTVFARNDDLGSLPTSTLVRKPKGATVVAVVNTNRGSCAAYAAPKVKRYFCAEDPETKVAYHTEIPFIPNQHLTHVRRGGDANTPGDEMKFDWDAPGPVTSVTYRQTAEFEVVESCTMSGNHAHCEGWINGGNGTIYMIVSWKQQCPPPDEETTAKK